jgi:hypothetical protein
VVARRRELGVLVVGGAFAMYAVGAAKYVHTWWGAKEDVRGAVEYVAAHRSPGDVVVVTLASNYGFSLYSPGAEPEYVRAPDVSMGFVTRARGVEGAVYVRGVTEADTTAALRQAEAAARRSHGRRIWVLRTHLTPRDREAWDATFRAFGVRPRSVRVGRASVETVWAVPVRG